MTTAYSACLIIGGLYAVISIIFSGLLDGLDFDFEFDFDFDFGALSLPIKPFTVMVFLTVFGASGLILQQALAPLVTLPIAIVLGLLVSYLLYRFFYLKLRRYETETASEHDALMKRAEVVERIPAGGYGKISFVIDGNTISGVAKEKKPLRGVDKGAQVYIMEIKKNVYYVVENLEDWFAKEGSNP